MITRSAVRTAIVFALALATLLGLGTWQVERLHWKTGLIERIRARAGAAPVPLPASVDDPGAWDFRPVTVTGRLRHDKALFLVARPVQGRVGFEVVTPLERPDGPPVLVNRGFVPMDRRDAGAGPADAPTVTVAGIARRPAPPGLFQPDNRTGADTWMRVDIPAMAAAAGLTEAAPVVVEAMPGPGLPAGIPPRVDLPNNHLQYAITWYGLAVVLVAVFVLSQRRRR